MNVRAHEPVVAGAARGDRDGAVDPASFAGSAVPVLVQIDGLPLTAFERAIVARFDGLRTLADVASLLVIPLARVQSIVAELAWQRAITLDELVQVDDVDLLDLHDLHDDDHREAEPEALPLAPGRLRRDAAATFPCTDEDASLVSMVLAALATMESSGAH